MLQCTKRACDISRRGTVLVLWCTSTPTSYITLLLLYNILLHLRNITYYLVAFIQHTIIPGGVLPARHTSDCYSFITIVTDWLQFCVVSLCRYVMTAFCIVLIDIRLCDIVRARPGPPGALDACRAVRAFPPKNKK